MPNLTKNITLFYIIIIPSSTKFVKREKEFSVFTLGEKIAELANNFRLWWPNGLSRNILEKRKDRKEDTTRDEELIKDLDRLIHEKGYENVPMSLDGDKLSEKAWEQRCLIVADIFLAMLSLGYSRRELAA